MAKDWTRISDQMGLYRDARNGWVAGVCAGLAKRLRIAPIWLRAGFLLAFLLMDNQMAPMLAYFVLAFLLKPDGEAASEQAGVQKAFSGLTETISNPFAAPPGNQLAGLQARFARLEARIVKAETAVTSAEMELRRQFRDLGA